MVQNRIGDHIWWISDDRNFLGSLRNWRYRDALDAIPPIYGGALSVTPAHEREWGSRIRHFSRNSAAGVSSGSVRRP
jgi:hypothetical protein